MADETDGPLDPDGLRLIPLSDIDAFVEVRAGAILDEAAILVIQFLGGGDRNASRKAFVSLAMERFDKLGDHYDDLRIVSRARAMAARRRQQREDDAAQAEQVAAAAETKPPEEPPKSE